MDNVEEMPFIVEKELEGTMEAAELPLENERIGREVKSPKFSENIPDSPAATNMGEAGSPKNLKDIPEADNMDEELSDEKKTQEPFVCDLEHVRGYLESNWLEDGGTVKHWMSAICKDYAVDDDDKPALKALIREEAVAVMSQLSQSSRDEEAELDEDVEATADEGDGSHSSGNKHEEGMGDSDADDEFDGGDGAGNVSDSDASMSSAGSVIMPRRRLTKAKGKHSKAKKVSVKQWEGAAVEAKEPSVEMPTAAVEELKAVQQIDQGPTASELKRRALIENDSSDEERLMELSRSKALHSLQQKVKPLNVLRKQEAVKAKAWFADQMTHRIKSGLIRRELHDKLALQGVVRFLEESEIESSDNSSDESDGHAEDGDGKVKTEVEDDVVQESDGAAGDDVIELTDSSDDSDNDAATNEVNSTLLQSPRVSDSTAGTTTPDCPVTRDANTLLYTSTYVKKALTVSSRVLNQRDSLRLQLKQRVTVNAAALHAKEFGQTSAEELLFISEIHSNTRIIKSLLAAKAEYREAREKIRKDKDSVVRRQQYQQHANASEEEYESDLDDDLYRTIMDKKQQQSVNTKAEEDKIRAEFANWSDEEEVGSDADGDDMSVVGDEDQNDVNQGLEEEKQVLEQLLEQQQLEDSQMQLQEAPDLQIPEAVATATSPTVAVPTVVTTYSRKRKLIVEESLEDSDGEAEPMQAAAANGSQPSEYVSGVNGESMAMAVATSASTGVEQHTDVTESEDAQRSISPAVAALDEDGDDGNAGHDNKRLKEIEKNVQWRRMIQQENARYARPGGRSRLLDEEAEEEEEDGLQSGLADYGFGNTAALKGNDEERNALIARKSDYEGIVDTNSDDEGDQLAGQLHRQQQLERDDMAQSKRIMEQLAKGVTGKQDKGRSDKARGRFLDRSLEAEEDELIRKDLGGEDGKGGEEPDDDVDSEEDYEEGFLRRMREKATMGPNQAQQDGAASSSDSSGEDHDSGEGSDNSDQESDDDLHQKKANKERLLQEKRRERLERKQFEENHKKRRALRRANSRQMLSQQEGSLLGDASAEDTAMSSRGGNGMFGSSDQSRVIKRRTQTLPAKHQHQFPARRRGPSQSQAAGASSGLMRSVSSASVGVGGVGPSASLFSRVNSGQGQGSSYYKENSANATKTAGDSGGDLYSGSLSTKLITTGAGLGMSGSGLCDGLFASVVSGTSSTGTGLGMQRSSSVWGEPSGSNMLQHTHSSGSSGFSNPGSGLSRSSSTSFLPRTNTNTASTHSFRALASAAHAKNSSSTGGCGRSFVFHTEDSNTNTGPRMSSEDSAHSRPGSTGLNRTSSVPHTKSNNSLYSLVQ